MFGFWEALIVLLLVLVVVGGERLPELGRAIGKMIRNAKDEVSENTIIQTKPANRKPSSNDKTS